MAHDFNNLLMVIQGNAENALEASRKGEDLTDDLDAVVEAVAQASALTNQLLAYAGRSGGERHEVNLTERVRSVSELLSSLPGSSGVEIQLELRDDLPAVLANAGEIQQLAMNRVLNAIEACDGAGRALVSTWSCSTP